MAVLDLHLYKGSNSFWKHVSACIDFRAQSVLSIVINVKHRGQEGGCLHSFTINVWWFFKNYWWTCGLKSNFIVCFPTCSLPQDLGTQKALQGQDIAKLANLCWAHPRQKWSTAVAEFPWALWSTVHLWHQMPTALRPHLCNSSWPRNLSYLHGKLLTSHWNNCNHGYSTTKICTAVKPVTLGCNTSHTLVVPVTPG